MRERPSVVGFAVADFGITPAYAGKTKLDADADFQKEGSPPRMRERHLKILIKWPFL
ncbi:hypothetical protein CGSMWGv6119V5_01908 [Gardnerella vaginalis 6119V5]|nr:hypothetical protein CGSMWGv6119V5_01908 [Gardnerella vaginalis 6119V5]